MLTATEAAAKLLQYKTSLGIPAAAELSFFEKRYIELANYGEIEAIIPMFAPAEDVQVELSEIPEADTAEEPIPTYQEHLTWVGRFVHEFLFWELALDRQGTLIRLRKSR